MPDMQSVNLEKCIHVASTAARESGALLMKHVGAPSKVETKKSAIDLVTEVDRASEVIIKKKLTKAFPSFGFLGEEHGYTPSEDDYRWIVDPLDGTMNFVHGIPFFGVSIGLERRGEMVAGVIFDPCRKELFTAIKGKGAFLNGQRIRVSKANRLNKSVLATGFSSKFRKQREPYLSWFVTFETRCHAVRRMGSTVLCLSYVACGRMEGFYERDLKPWDIAAGIVIVQEAKGCTSNTEGKALKLEEGSLVATNGHIHRQLLRAL